MGLEHRDDGTVAIALDALHLAPGVRPNDLVAQLDVRGVLPAGHFDGRRGVAVRAVQFAARQFAAASPNGATAVDVQLPEVVDFGARFPSSAGIGRPAGDRLPAAEDGRFAGRGPIDHVMSGGAAVAMVEDERF
jgi:hypothetical protein